MFPWKIILIWKCSVTRSCLTFDDLMSCSLPGSSVHVIFQARILEWVATSSSRGSSWPRDQICISCIAGRFFTAEYIEELTPWKRLWCWEGLAAGGEGDDRGWDGWMASLTDGLSLSEVQELVMDREVLACCDSWGRKELDATERLNWSELTDDIC